MPPHVLDIAPALELSAPGGFDPLSAAAALWGIDAHPPYHHQQRAVPSGVVKFAATSASGWVRDCGPHVVSSTLTF